MTEGETGRLARVLAASEAEVARLRLALAGANRVRDEARILEEITGDDGGTNPFAAAVRATRMPMVIADPRLPDTPIVFLNDAFTRLTGYGRDEIMGRNCRFLQGPGTDPATVAAIGEAVRSGTMVHTDILNYRKDGRTFWNRLLMAPVRDGGGEVAYFFASQVDVTLERERLDGLETHNAALMAEVSDRLHAQEEVARRLTFAAGAGRLGIWEMDASTSDVDASPVFVENHGLPPDAPVTAEAVALAVHPGDRALRQAAIDASLSTGADLDVEYRVGAAGQPTRWVQVRAQVVPRADGRPARIAGVSLDATDRKASDLRRRVNAELADAIRDARDPDGLARASARILGTALDVARVGVGIVDLASETVAIDCEWTSPDRPGLPCGPATADLGAHGADLLEGRVLAIADTHRDGKALGSALSRQAPWVRSLMALPLTEASGFMPLVHLAHDAPRHWSGRDADLVREVAERVMAAARRMMAERDLKALADSLERQVEDRTRERDRLWRLSEDLLVLADYRGRLLRVSPSWGAALGLPEAEITARGYGELTHPDDRARAMATLARMRRTGSPARLEARMRRADGTYGSFAWRLSPDPDGRGLIGTGRDVTDERARASELEAAQESLRQSQKLEALGQLTGGVAHDFNNLLTVIRSSVDMLSRPNLSDERRRRYVAAISDTTTRATRLTGQLLAFARRQSLQPEVFDANAAALAVRDIVGTLVGSRVVVEVATSAEPCEVDADPSQFDTALVNLAVNARDAMGGEGTLRVAVSRVAAVPASGGRTATDGAHVAVSVADTGTGIAPGDLGRIFEPFFTTKGVGQGTGLGLSQVFGFVKQSGGEVDVESEVGKGTTFTLYLPLAARVADASGAVADAGSADGRGLTVLVVEDNAMVGASTSAGLHEFGFATVLAADARQALLALGSDPGAFDVVFSDVVMPGMDGIGLGEFIRGTYPDLPVVLASGYSHVLAREGTHGFELVHKPYSPQELARTLRRVATAGAVDPARVRTRG